MNATVGNMIHRMQVVDEAWEHINEHYVWSGGGARPGQADGMPGHQGGIEMLPNVLEKGSPQLAFHAAYARHPGGKTYVCAGRCEAIGVIDGGGSRDLDTYLAEKRALSPSEVQSYQRFSNTPRYVPELKKVV